ncbi:uncharacterized protein TNIN_14661 [Trichonephila inaurata madagascariensis]|uniref:Uncharacterized protein n=1 Tax=Trichonephila inaurata madagascariensis TaxID=2747483 RepID=A0A8X6YDR6_9ARAC|nr:uncharacterized protein TNIN_14661 [Trichonephila inaurata madagascariensis]
MTIDFWPTLQLMAYARLAQSILYTFNLEILKRRFMFHLNVRPTYLKAIEEEVNKRIIPTVFRKKLIGVVTSLAWEVYKWFDCHGHFFQDSNLDLRNKLHWYSFGIIDRRQTADNFILDGNLNIRERFHLACKYCLEEDVHMLWMNMLTEDQIHEFVRLRKTGTIEIWNKTLYRNDLIDFEELSFNERLCFVFENYLGLRNYFSNLRGSLLRCQCFYFALECRRVHHFDLYSCLVRMNADDELNFMLISFPDLDFSKLFQIFLQWPFQNMFLDVVTNFQGYINEHVFYDLVQFILFEKLDCWQDHPYEKLFVLFWNLFGRYEDHVKKDAYMCAIVKYVLDNSEDFDRRKYWSFIDSVI